MLRKETKSEGVIGEQYGKPFMRVTKMITEYRLFGILLYRKTLYTPSNLAEGWDGFMVDF
jgi:hypothetical protein